MSANVSLGWIGMGRMGYPMAELLLKAGYRVSIYNRTRAKAEPLAAKGGTIVDRPSELAGCDIVFAMVSTGKDLEHVYFGDGGLLTGSGKKPRILVDCSSIGIDQSEAIRKQINAAGCEFVSSPVSGNGSEPIADVAAAVGPEVVLIATDEGEGSGIIYDKSGLIVTNAHVVGTSTTVAVQLADGTVFETAKVVGADTVRDVAVVKVDAKKDLPAATFGRTDDVRVGQTAVAIGSPFGLEQTVTAGIVSAVGRVISNQNPVEMIQTDAPINPGNSGGPLVDARGQVIGVNTLGINEVPQAGPVQGLFFAIPSNTVQQIVTQLLSAGQVTYPYLGAQIEEITPDIAGQYNLPVDFGAMVADVSPDSPAAQAGIQQGDIITALGDQKLDAETSFSELLFAHKPGDQVTLTVQRPDGSHDVAVTLGTRPTGQ